MENFKFARICSATDYGMNEGYCCHDGEFYFADERDLIHYLRSLGGYEGMSDEFVMKDAYDADIAGVGLGLEWAPFNPIFFSAEVSTGYIMKNTNKNELFTGASAGIHVFF